MAFRLLSLALQDLPPWAWAVGVPMAFGIGLILLLRHLRHDLAALIIAARDERMALGQSLLLEPDAASYRGARRDYGRVKCDGAMLLTDVVLLFLPLIGRAREVPLERVVSVREERWFLGALRVGQKHLVLTLDDDNEIGFYTRDNVRWIEALAARGIDHLPASSDD